MSNLSIYQTSWINLVFEDRNKEYGAYQLRKESFKTTLLALFYALVLIVLIVSIPLILSLINGNGTQIAVAKDIPKMPTVVTFSPKKPETPKKAFVPPTKLQSKTSASKPTLANPVVVEKTNESPIVPTNKNQTSTTSNTNPTANEGDGQLASNPSSGGNSNETRFNSDTVLDRNELDKNPEFPGGIKVFLNYVGTNFRTPEIEMEQTVKVYVSFIVEIDGSMSNIKVENDPGYGLGKEAIRVLKSLKTKWEAGQKEGQKVRTFYNLPISVELK